MQMDGGTVSYTLRSANVRSTVIAKAFRSIKFDRWARLEFELEQALLANIRLEVKESSADYTITISN